MSVADKTLFLCSCNGTQPLDAAALATALALPRRRRYARCCARRSSPDSPTARKAT